MKRNFLKITLVAIVLSITSCKTTSDAGNDTASRSTENRGQRGGQQRGGGQEGGQQRGQRPTSDQIIAQMDANKDGKLSKSEVKGPLENDFSSVDTNNDGFLTKEEIDNAPKPERGQGGGGQRR